MKYLLHPKLLSTSLTNSDKAENPLNLILLDSVFYYWNIFQCIYKEYIALWLYECLNWNETNQCPSVHAIYTSGIRQAKLKC